MYRRITLALVALLAAALGTIGLGAGQPASAATAVSGCFKWGDTRTAYAGQPVYLQRRTSTGTWTSIRSGTTNSSGCATFLNTPSGDSLTIKAYKTYGNGNIGMAIWESSNTNWATPGTGGVALGSKYVNHTGCTWGLYAYCAGQG